MVTRPDMDGLPSYRAYPLPINNWSIVRDCKKSKYSKPLENKEDNVESKDKAIEAKRVQ